MVSIQCTGQALNLACANRVVVLDVWFNSAIEQQAFGRVYRIGQTKHAVFGRIMAKNTIDERLAELQAQKLRMIDKTIKDHDSSKVTPTAEEIASLFGRLVRDEEGNIAYIEADYDDDETEADEERWSANETEVDEGESGSCSGDSSVEESDPESNVPDE